ncbi:MAG: 30S ribosomal protein S17 [Patescibacteria group bacterium]
MNQNTDKKIIKKNPKTLTGTVVSNRSAKTIVVEVDRLIKHKTYGKYLSRSKRYLAHAPTGQYELGQTVKIRETRPLSRRKHFIVL